MMYRSGRCKGITDRGARCKAPAMWNSDSQRCRAHDPSTCRHPEHWLAGLRYPLLCMKCGVRIGLLDAALLDAPVGW